MIIATEVYSDTIGVGSFSAYVNGQCYATKASTTNTLTAVTNMKNPRHTVADGLLYFFKVGITILMLIILVKSIMIT
mgnify:CR=1 FL=1